MADFCPLYPGAGPFIDTETGSSPLFPGIGIVQERAAGGGVTTVALNAASIVITGDTFDVVAAGGVYTADLAPSSIILSGESFDVVTETEGAVDLSPALINIVGGEVEAFVSLPFVDIGAASVILTGASFDVVKSGLGKSGAARVKYSNYVHATFKRTGASDVVAALNKEIAAQGEKKELSTTQAYAVEKQVLADLEQELSRIESSVAGDAEEQRVKLEAAVQRVEEDLQMLRAEIMRAKEEELILVYLDKRIKQDAVTKRKILGILKQMYTKFISE